MSRVFAARRFQFCAGHRVYQHESKCANLHGHNYVMNVYIEGPKLDPLGRVQDFGAMKDSFLPWIEHNWDHGFLWYEKDPVCNSMFNSSFEKRQLGFYAELAKMKNFKCSFNPTAENMALYILEEIGPTVLVGSGVEIVKIELWETENCKVEVTKDIGAMHSFHSPIPYPTHADGT